MDLSEKIDIYQEQAFLDWKEGATKRRTKQVTAALILSVLTVVTAWRCGVDVKSFIVGINKGIPLVGMFFPPTWGSLIDMLPPIGVTTAMAMLATLMGMCLSLPCALAASSNLAPPSIRLAVRFFIGLERGLPEIVQMLLLIAIFGLGIIPALIALSFSSIGMLAKLLADAIEEIEPHVLESVQGTGATRSQVIRYAVIPEVLPSLIANGLFRFEFNVRAGVILGAVGAGGIGYVMSTSMESMDYPRACMATLLTLALVFIAERISDVFRARIFKGGVLQ